MMKDQEKIGIFQGNHYRRSKCIFDFFPQNKSYLQPKSDISFIVLQILLPACLKSLHSDVVFVSFVKEHVYPSK